MERQKRADWLKLIQNNIVKYGHHITLVVDGDVPKFAYTIGLTEKFGAELVFAGGYYFNLEEIKKIINKLAQCLSLPLSEQEGVSVSSLGSFYLRSAHISWTEKMLLGVIDVYKKDQVRAFQIVPDQQHITLDVPNLSLPWDKEINSIWRCLDKSEKPIVPSNLLGITNLDVLRGSKVTEVAKWEESQWELFAGSGSEVLESEMRVVPLGILVAIDRSIEIVTSLAVGKALWRDPLDLVWHNWS